jgi:hypothetical protein
MKAPQTKWDVEDLHRHPDFAPVRKELPPVSKVKQESKEVQTAGERPISPIGAEFEDEFGGDIFEGVDLGDSTGDIGTVDSDSTITSAGPRPAETTNPTAASWQPMQRNQSLPATKEQDGASAGLRSGNEQSNHQLPKQQLIQQPGRPSPQKPSPGGNTQANSRPDSAHRMPPSNETQQHPRGPAQHYQPPHNNASHSNNQRPQGPSESALAQKLAADRSASSDLRGPAPSVGFVTGRAAELLQKAPSDSNAPVHAPAFNPHAESPSLRRTSGINHNRSAPVRREAIASNHTDNANLQPLSQNSGASTATASHAGGLGRPNFINPQSDANRRIGMPGHMNAPSPLGNRGAYKPPGLAQGVKRGSETQARAPLTDVSNVDNTMILGADALESKKAKIAGGMQ